MKTLKNAASQKSFFSLGSYYAQTYSMATTMSFYFFFYVSQKTLPSLKKDHLTDFISRVVAQTFFIISQ